MSDPKCKACKKAEREDAQIEADGNAHRTMEIMALRAKVARLEAPKCGSLCKWVLEHYAGCDVSDTPPGPRPEDM